MLLHNVKKYFDFNNDDGKARLIGISRPFYLRPFFVRMVEFIEGTIPVIEQSFSAAIHHRNKKIGSQMYL